MFLSFEVRHPVVLSYNNYVHSRHNKVYIMYLMPKVWHLKDHHHAKIRVLNVETCCIKLYIVVPPYPQIQYPRPEKNWKTREIYGS